MHVLYDVIMPVFAVCLKGCDLSNGTCIATRSEAGLDYMWLQHLELPILAAWRLACHVVEYGLNQTDHAGIVNSEECCGPWWHVLAVLPSITFAQDENGQHIRQG